MFNYILHHLFWIQHLISLHMHMTHLTNQRRLCTALCAGWSSALTVCHNSIGYQFLSNGASATEKELQIVHKKSERWRNICQQIVSSVSRISELRKNGEVRGLQTEGKEIGFSLYCIIYFNSGCLVNRCQPRGQPLHLALFLMVFSNAMQIKSFIVLPYFQCFPIWSKLKLLKWTERSFFLMDLQLSSLPTISGQHISMAGSLLGKDL